MAEPTKPKIKFTQGTFYGDTGKGAQNFRIVYEIVNDDFQLLGDGGYRERILKDPLGVLENEQALLNVTPFGAGNAGNNIYLLNGRKVPTHLLPPATLLTPFTISMLGALKNVNLESLYGEIELANSYGCEIVPGKNLFIDQYATITLPQDIELDKAMNKELRGTFKGAGPSSARRRFRFDVRAADLLRLDEDDVKKRIKKGVDTYNALLRDNGAEEYSYRRTMNWLKKWGKEFGKEFIVDGKKLVDLARKNPLARIFVNGTQGTCLDGDIGSIGRSVSYGVGLQDALKGAYLPINIQDYLVHLVKKAYGTRAGAGVFPGEFKGNEAKFLSKIGQEIGVTSGNIRRTGLDNFAEIRYQVGITAPGLTSTIITKVDVYGEFMNKFGPQQAILRYRRPNGETFDHLSFPEKGIKFDLSEEYHWGKFSPADVREMVNEGFDALPRGLQEYLRMHARETRAPVAAISLGPYLNNTVVKGLYEETLTAID